MLREKTELLNNCWTELHSVIGGDILKEKADLKVYVCSKKVFQKSDKRTQDNASVMWLVWNELLNESTWKQMNQSSCCDSFVFSKDKNMEAYTWENIIWAEKSCIAFSSPCECKCNTQHKCHVYFMYFENCSKNICGNHFPHKWRDIYDLIFKKSMHLKSGIFLVLYYL